MKQLLQNVGDGTIRVVEAPKPSAGPNSVVIAAGASLISAGTEKMLIEFGRANYLQKALQQPERVREVLRKVRSDGLFATVDSVRSKLSDEIPLGYSNVGRVLEVGRGVQDLAPGDRVVSNGPHADLVVVPRNLCARVPDGVADQEACFTVVASIALQGVRLALPTLGETFVVTGAGLIGLLTTQILLANGCRVLVSDYDSARLEFARNAGATTCDLSKGEDVLAVSKQFSQGRGADGVIVTASTRSSSPIHEAAEMSRQRGKIVMVGVTGLELQRADFYAKELTFQVSCSYGPGRYDPDYEEHGHDYPFGFVRWTAQRNFEAVLDLMATQKLRVASLVSHAFDFEQVSDAYDLLASPEPSLGIVLSYQEQDHASSATSMALGSSLSARSSTVGPAVVGVIGAGNYASRVMVPTLKKANAVLHTIVSRGGVSGAVVASKEGFARVATEAEDIFSDPAINSIFIATRHDSHAELASRALAAGKHTYVEKPLAIDAEGLTLVSSALDQTDCTLMVGFNRRFAPLVQEMKRRLASTTGPMNVSTIMNAGAVPEGHWTLDPLMGGGRIVGEACHHIDLVRYLIGAPIIDVNAVGLGDSRTREENATITLSFSDGSTGCVQYFANGASSFPKERVEVFCNSRILCLDNFRSLRAWGWPGYRGTRSFRQEKGHLQCIEAFLSAVAGGPPPISPEEICEVTKATLEAATKLRGWRESDEV